MFLTLVYKLLLKGHPACITAFVYFSAAITLIGPLFYEGFSPNSKLNAPEEQNQEADHLPN
ncbi:hypothetical protein [Domibacillus sp.]|uniref:hypothetical protein n=1 Tax=Domibacillus sp. TaxID=1969783 RepID=UPI0028122C06|nr:hypothetical protein [Domibacillus sp.]